MTSSNPNYFLHLQVQSNWGLGLACVDVVGDTSIQSVTGALLQVHSTSIASSLAASQSQGPLALPRH